MQEVRLVNVALRNLVTRGFAIPGVADLFIGAGLKDDLKLPSYTFGAQ